MLSELFANLALEGWVREREPASLPALRTFPRCFATIDSTRFAVTALERMDQALDARPDGPIIYAWYQCMLHCRARRVWDAAGPGVLAGLHERFRDSPPVTDLRAFLVADLDPVFGAVIDAWPTSPRAPDAGESGGPDEMSAGAPTRSATLAANMAPPAWSEDDGAAGSPPMRSRPCGKRGSC